MVVLKRRLENSMDSNLTIDRVCESAFYYQLLKVVHKRRQTDSTDSYYNFTDLLSSWFDLISY